METAIQLISIIVPVVAVSVVCVLLVKKFIEGQRTEQLLKMKTQNNAKVLPLKLQAYERITILLERIRANSLVLRVYKPGMSAQYLRGELLKGVRGEVEHNQSQQIYVGDTIWQMVLLAREETAQMINIVGEAMKEGDSGETFSQKLLELNRSIEKSPVDEAIKLVKQELRQLI
jgi:membrane protein implicated in regulation of membrane protease activity